MKVKEIVLAFAEHPQSAKVLDLVQSNGNSIVHLDGLMGSANSVLLASLFINVNKNIVVLLPNDDLLEFYQSDLIQLLGENFVLPFPSSFRSAGDFENYLQENIQVKTETLTKLEKKLHPYIILTTPESILEKVIHKQEWQKVSFDIELNQTIDTEFLADFLDEHHFERDDFVYEPGQYAMRGCIIDIFSFSNELPYRIELDGDSVSSIRTFNPENQISVTQMGKLSIVPNLSSNQQNTQFGSVFQYFNKNEDVIFLNHYADQYEFIKKQWENFYESENQNQAQQFWVEAKEIFDEIEAFNTKIESGGMKFFKSNNLIKFNQKPQPIFKKNIELILSDFLKNESENIINFIFSEKGKQIERLLTIFEDRQQKVNIIPIYHSLAEGFVDQDLKMAFYTEHQLFERYFKYKSIKKGFSKSAAITLKELKDLKIGDFVTHIDHGVGKFMGLQTITNDGVKQEAVKISYRDGDLLFVSVNSLHKISKFSDKDGTEPKLHKLGSGVWEKQKQSTKKKVKDIARELIKLYAKRKSEPGYCFSPDSYLQVELEASFMHEDTPDQAKATEEIKQDMESQKPMDRLLCGDVGFGKTEVAIRSAFKAVNDSKQVAVLVPTTILAHQHYRTFKNRLKDLPVNVDYINRFKSQKEQTLTLKKLKEGKIDIIIGTHRLVSKDIEFKDLGLLIIDEEQKFGVSVKDKLKQIRTQIDTLTLTATPIPRTLHFSLMGARDLSVINTPPTNRFPIKTEIHTFNEETIKKAIQYEISRGGQVFFVHHRVKDLEDLKFMINRLIPGIRVSIAHGQMEGSDLEDVMYRFMEGDDDVLIATTIIEAGLDIPNCNTIIINQAHHFGLSDLHQMRGRVGRSDKKAYCYLMAPPLHTLTSDAKKRLCTLEEYSDLGGGFQVAMRDLDIRGAGNLLGGEQSGFINEIGFDTYHKILDEAIRELKREEFSGLFTEFQEDISSRDCQIDIDKDIMIPDYYVNNVNERMSLYSELSNINNEEELEKFSEKLIDRFGAYPETVSNLLSSVRLKWKGKSLGFEKISLDKGLLKIFLPSDENAAFYDHHFFHSILQHISLNPAKFDLKQTNKTVILKVRSVHNMIEANEFLKELTQIKNLPKS